MSFCWRSKIFSMKCIWIRKFSYPYINMRGRRVIGISGSLIWLKTQIGLIFNFCDEFLWSPDDPVSQIGSPHLHVGAPGIFSDLLRSGQMLKWVRRGEGCGKQRGATAPIQCLVKLQPLFLSLWWKTCVWQNCSLGSCVCSEGPAFGQKTLVILTWRSARYIL